MSLAITSLSFNQSGVYNAGDAIQLTINYTETDFTPGQPATESDQVTATVANSVGSTPLSQGITISSTGAPTPDPTSVSVTDSGNRTWTVVSNTQVSVNADGSSVWQALVTATA
jgi:hypothetical protein